MDSPNYESDIFSSPDRMAANPMHNVLTLWSPHFQETGAPAGGATEQMRLSRFFWFFLVCLCVCLFKSKQLMEKLAVDMRSSSIIRYVLLTATGRGSPYHHWDPTMTPTQQQGYAHYVRVIHPLFSRWASSHLNGPYCLFRSSPSLCVLFLV